MKKLHVSKIPSKLTKQLIDNSCTEPNLCFRNCALAVSNFNFADTYVLCFLEDNYGNMHGHALIKIGDEYYDPTLEAKSEFVNGYWLHTEMTKQQLRDFVKSWYQDIKINENGEAEVYPPALLKNGTIACQKVEPA